MFNSNFWNLLKLKIMKIETNVKIILDYYLNYVLILVLKENLHHFMQTIFVVLCCIGISLRAISLNILLTKMRNEIGIEAIPFKCRPYNSLVVFLWITTHLDFKRKLFLSDTTKHWIFCRKFEFF